MERGYYIYLASPYSHPDDSVRLARYEQVLGITATFINQGHFVYSPIVHCHEMQQRYSLPGQWEFWQQFDTAMIQSAEALWVLKMDGWQESVGVKAEIEIAERLGIPVTYIEVYATAGTE